MKHLNNKKAIFITSALSLAVLSGCSDSDSIPVAEPEPTPTPTPAPSTVDFKVTFTNLTPNQPFTPVTLLGHGADYNSFVAGETASLALENLAESGSNSGYENEDGVEILAATEGLLSPGSTASLTVSFSGGDVSRLSVLTMFANTNDAFTGVNSYDLSSLAAGDKVSFRTNVYDAGTEANSEAKGTIPGPADGGEGFNEARDDVNRVHIHPGVISADDGLADSVLNASHRFDNPAMTLTIERVQ